MLDTLPFKQVVFVSKHEKLAPRQEVLVFKAPPVMQETLCEDTSLLVCCLGACQFRARGSGRQGCGGVMGGVLLGGVKGGVKGGVTGMVTGLEIMLVVEAFPDGGGVALLVPGGVALLVPDPLTTCVGAEGKLPRLSLEGGAAAGKEVHARRIGDPMTTCCRGLAHEGGVA